MAVYNAVLIWFVYSPSEPDSRHSSSWLCCDSIANRLREPTVVDTLYSIGLSLWETTAQQSQNSYNKCLSAHMLFLTFMTRHTLWIN